MATAHAALLLAALLVSSSSTASSRPWLSGPRTSAVLWEVSGAHDIGFFLSSVTAGDDGSVFALTSQFVCSLDGDTGALKWKQPARGNFSDVTFGATPSVALSNDGTILFAINTFGIAAFSSTSGEARWEFELNGAVAVLAGRNGAVFVARRRRGYSSIQIYSLAEKTGAQLWVFETESSVSPSLSLSVDGSTLYPPTHGGDIFALDAASGYIRWTATLPNTEIPSFTAVDDSNRVIVSNADTVYALSASGTTLWSTPIVNGSLMLGPVVGAAGEVYFATPDAIITLDGQSGEVLLHTPILLGSTIYATRFAVGANGLTYFSAGSPSEPMSIFLISVNITSGVELWRFPLMFSFTYPVIGFNGTLLMSSFFTMYAFNDAGTYSTSRFRANRDAILMGAGVSVAILVCVLGGACWWRWVTNKYRFRRLDDMGPQAAGAAATAASASEEAEGVPTSTSVVAVVL